jgi:hypothetical protein
MSRLSSDFYAISPLYPSNEEPMCMWCNKTRSLQRGIGIVRDGPLVKAEDAR